MAVGMSYAVGGDTGRLARCSLNHLESTLILVDPTAAKAKGVAWTITENFAYIIRSQYDVCHHRSRPSVPSGLGEVDSGSC
ncbi:hypothetical protein J1614_006551 [Plenodomus biglobosus]|nr:hypothetical protein J1614_006551 [Plenodomus biglobosus]